MTTPGRLSLQGARFSKTYQRRCARNEDRKVEVANESKIRVLVVDDDHAIRDTLRLVLEEEGYAVTDAPDGEAALDTLRSTSEPQVVLLDLRMPRLDGGRVLSIVQEDVRLAGRDIFILITANLTTLPLAIATLLDRLDVPVLPKPFDMDELLAVVAAAARRLTSPSATILPRALDASR